MLFLHACSYVGFLTLVEQVDSNGLLWNLLLLPFFILLFYYFLLLLWILHIVMQGCSRYGVGENEFGAGNVFLAY
jgi:hypothetical protein